MFKHVGDLGGGDAHERERRELILNEELCVGGFMTVSWSAPDKFGKEKKFVGVKGVEGMAVEVTVEDGSEFGDADIVARFFACFAGGSNRRRLADVGPTAGEGPATVLKFANKKNAALLESGHTNIDLGRGVTRLLGKEFRDWQLRSKSAASSHHLGRDFADLVVAMDVELILAIGEPGLSDGLQPPSPDEPLRNGHEDILAAADAADKSRMMGGVPARNAKRWLARREKATR